MTLKDSVRAGEKEIHRSSETQHLGEDRTRTRTSNSTFPGSKQVKHVIAGGVAGAVSRTCVSPLERVKILLQVGPLNSSNLV